MTPRDGRLLITAKRFSFRRPVQNKVHHLISRILKALRRAHDHALYHRSLAAMPEGHTTDQVRYIKLASNEKWRANDLRSDAGENEESPGDACKRR